MTSQPIMSTTAERPSRLAAMTASRLFHFSTGLLAALVFFVLIMAELHKLGVLLNQPDVAGTQAEFYATVATSVSKTIFLALVVTLFLIRKPPIEKADGLAPRLAALGGTFLIPVVIVFLPTEAPTLVQSMVGLALVAAGSLLSAVVIITLGRSFSLMAEARELVTHGAYGIVRHPLYLAEEIAIIGVIVLFFSLPAVLLAMAHAALQLKRMSNEEAVLGKAFPDYRPYTARTSRIIPGVY